MATTPRCVGSPRPPITSGFPFNSGLRSSSTAAKKASMSTWRMRRGWVMHEIVSQTVAARRTHPRRPRSLSNPVTPVRIRCPVGSQRQRSAVPISDQRVERPEAPGRRNGPASATRQHARHQLEVRHGLHRRRNYSGRTRHPVVWGPAVRATFYRAAYESDARQARVVIVSEVVIDRIFFAVPAARSDRVCRLVPWMSCGSLVIAGHGYAVGTTGKGPFQFAVSLSKVQ